MRAPLWGGLAAAVLSAGATPAPAADVPGDRSTRAVLQPGPAGVTGAFERRGDSDWYKVALKGGQNYAVASSSTVEGCQNVKLRRAGGTVIDTAGSYQDNDDGFEFRPAGDGTYLVEFKDLVSCPRDYRGYPGAYRGNVTADARGDTTTAAAIKVGETIDGVANWGYDRDYFRATLRTGESYSITTDRRIELYVMLVDAEGRVVEDLDTGLSGVRVPRDGTYYVVVWSSDDGGARYAVTLATP